MLKQTQNILKRLRELNQYQSGEIKINSWVDEYIDKCILNSKTITIISPYSISPRLEGRYKRDKCFKPTNAEIKLFEKEIPLITELFLINSLKVNWWLYLAPSCLDSTRLNINLEYEYTKMLLDLNENGGNQVEIVHWEKDVLGKKQYPNPTLANVDSFNSIVDKEMFDSEVNRRLGKWLSYLTPNEILEETRYKIACEAEEGRILMEENPFCFPGEFLYMSFNSSEKLKFFSLITPDFYKRIVSVLKKYPWR